MSTAALVFVWLLAVIGLFELLFACISFLFLAPIEKTCGAVELCHDTDNAEYLIRSALLRHHGTVYIIDCGASEEALEIAQLFAQKYERLKLLTAAAFGKNSVD